MQCWSCGALIYLFEDGWTGKRWAELWHIFTCCDRHLHHIITIQHTVRITRNTFSNHIIFHSNIWQKKWWQTLYVVSSVPGFSTWTRIKAWRKLEAIMSGTKVWAPLEKPQPQCHSQCDASFGPICRKIPKTTVSIPIVPMLELCRFWS